MSTKTNTRYAYRLPDVAFCSGRRTEEVSGRQCYQAELGGTSYPRCLRPLHAFVQLVVCVEILLKCYEMATPLSLCIDFVRPLSSVLHP